MARTDLMPQALRDADVSDAALVAARVGYAARGFLYCTVSVLALLVATGRGGRLTDNKGALQALHVSPLGDVVVSLVGVGLACYGVWSLVRALRDPERSVAESRTLVRVCVRIGYAVVAVTHGLLAWAAFGLVVGEDARSSGTRGTVAELLRLPLGRALVGGVGLVLLGIGVVQLFRGVTGKLSREYRASGLGAPERRMALRVARVGVVARAVVFGLMGTSFVVAAWRVSPREAQGVGEALRSLLHQPYGAWLMGVVALGLLAFGLAQGFIARYGDLPRPS